MLTEVDWNSVKKAVAVGALSMAALGLPNLSHADAQKMTSAELKSWVQQNVQNKPAPQVQQIVNKINAVQPVAPAQKPSVVAPKSVPAPAVQTSIAKAEPVKVEPKLEPVKVEPKLEPESPVHPGEFSIKGLKFGMTLDQVIGVTQATENDYTKPMDTKTYTQPQKPATDWFRAIDDKFSVGGVYGWHAEKENDTLQGLSTFPRSENVDIALNKFIEKYGKPKIRQYRSKTKGGVDLNVFEAEWRVPGAVITMMNHIDRDKGYIKIQSIDSYNKEQQKYKDQSEKASKDF
jgi:hypothetical protein